MSTFAEVFRQWTDFPKGLQVLVVDRDTQFLQDITYKLEGYQYFVTSFTSEEEACRALTNYSHTFHVAVVEATESDGLDSCKILSFSKDMPTIMTSTMENMSLMVKLIALGAVEFLVKPLSEDKIRNIWQHVIRKALDSSRETLPPGYLQPGKPTSASELLGEEHQACSAHEVGHPQLNCLEKEHHNGMEVCRHLRLSVACERLAAPSTPQLEQGGRTALQESTLDESPRSHDSTEVCNYKENTTPQTAAESLFTRSADVKEEATELPTISTRTTAAPKVEKTMNQQDQIFCCTIPMLESHDEAANTSQITEDKAVDSGNSSKDKGHLRKALHCDAKATMEACEMSSTNDYEPQEARSSSTISQPVISKDTAQCLNAESTCQSETPASYQDKGDANNEGRIVNNKGGKDSKIAKKKIKVDWTADLHRRFVQAVEYLGVDQAIPSRILEVMKVEGLTRHNVASHLQKYRSHKKHVQARELEASKHQSKLNCGRPWNCVGQSVNQMWIQARPQLICPPLHVWGHPKVDHSATVPMAHYIATGAPVWPAFDTLSWKPAPMADSWAPALPSAALYYGPQPNFFATSGYPHREGTWRSFLENVENASPDEKLAFNKSDCLELHTPKELLDAAISEALSKPWMPLPLGLKPPSMESVMAELQRQGMTTSLSSV